MRLCSSSNRLTQQNLVSMTFATCKRWFYDMKIIYYAFSLITVKSGQSAIGWKRLVT